MDTAISMGEYKKKKQSPRWHYILLLVLIIVNLAIPAIKLLDRLEFTKWPESLDIDKIELAILKSYPLEGEDDYVENNVNEKDEFYSQLMENSKINKRLSGNSKSDYTTAQFDMLRYNIENSLFNKADIDHFETKFFQAQSDGTIEPYESQDLLNIIKYMNNRSIKRIFNLF